MSRSIAILVRATCSGWTQSTKFRFDSLGASYTTAQAHHNIPVRVEANLQLTNMALNLAFAALVGTGVFIFDLFE